MSQRRVIKIGLFAFLFVAVLTLLSVIAWRYLQLSLASRKIVDNYSEQITLLSEYLLTRPDWKVREENWQEEKKALEQLGKAFTEDAFFYVRVSTDGHHGLTSVKDWDKRENNLVITQGVLWATGAKPEHKIHMGWSNKGERFYVYDAWEPEAKHMRHFQFWIRSSLLDSTDK